MWECTRRSPEYKKVWKPYSSRSDRVSNPKSTSAITEEEHAAAAKFGLLFFRGSLSGLGICASFLVAVF